MLKITIPGILCELTDTEKEQLEALFFKFGKVRRRAYRLKQKGWSKAATEAHLQFEIGLNSRYIKDAYWFIKDLPPHVTFGGLRTQRLREKGTISKEEYHKRRNAILISRGDKAKKGNLNLRVDLQTMRLRANIGSKTWIYPKLFIPPKYLTRYRTLLDGLQPYTVLLKRHETKAGYLVKITVEIPSQVRRGTRLMTLDVNAGHTDFAITNKCTEQVVVTGKINHYETQHVRKGKRDALLYKLVAKIGRVAAHYQADIAVGKLNTGKFQGGRKANRQIHQLPHYKFRHLLIHQLTKRDIQVQERSEAYTSILGKKIAPLLGLDIHKAAAISFGIKILNYSQFRNLLSEVRPNEGRGSLRAKHRRGSELTAPYQSALTLVSDETHPSGDYPAIPGSGGLLTAVSNWKANSIHLRMKIY